tara:strand:- start:2927 stop:4690 length:1764 start_codon:yes stop_codon:yes gene_type:complete
MKTYALDFETYYDKDCSIKKLGFNCYFSHPDFDAYKLSVVGDDGTSFVGCPKEEFDWSILEGHRVLAHNASFDESLYLFGVTKGWWPSVKYAEWHCTADLAAYCGLPRSLKGATSVLYDLEMDKSTRDNMAGKRWEDMDEDFKKEVDEYALKDSEYCLDLWRDLQDKWPEDERGISRINRLCMQRGVPIDAEELKKQKENINIKLFEAENNIPWLDTATPLSRKAFNEECRKMGLEPPVSLSMTDDDANAWIKKHGHEYKWIGAVRDYRRINSLKRKLESFDNATMDDGRYYGGLMYFGAHTGRFSGSGGNLNLQNLPRGELLGTNLRKLISPSKDKKLIVADLSQIEVRTLCWLSEDTETLEVIRNSDDIYEGFACQFNLWDESKGSLKDEDPKLRHRVKTMVLGCGYGVSANKFSMISGMSIDEAMHSVRLYRTSMKKVVGLWNTIQRKLHIAYSKKEDFILELPSGRQLNYGKIKTTIQNNRRNYVAMLTKGAKKIPIRLWGGLLAENISQALARDIFSDMLVRLEQAGLKVIFHVHDEFVIEIEKEEAQKGLDKVLDVMKTPPPWISDIPLDAEGKIVTEYEK